MGLQRVGQDLVIEQQQQHQHQQQYQFFQNYRSLKSQSLGTIRRSSVTLPLLSSVPLIVLANVLEKVPFYLRYFSFSK